MNLNRLLTILTLFVSPYTCTMTKILNLNDRLWHAVANNDYIDTKTCLIIGANPNVIFEGKTPLLLAVSHNNYYLSKLLLEHGADPDSDYTSKFISPLALAIKGKNVAIVKLLIDFDASVLVYDDHRPILYRALSARNIPICLLLAESFPVFRYKNFQGDMAMVFEALKCCSKYTLEDSKIITRVLDHANFLVFMPDRKFNKFLESYNRIWAALFVFHRLCPSMPKDIKKLILYRHLQDDIKQCNTFGKLSTITENDSMNFPAQIIRMLIARKQLDSEKTIDILTEHTSKNVSRIFMMIPVSEREFLYDTENSPNIRYNLRKRLGLLSWYENLYEALPNNPCMIQ